MTVITLNSTGLVAMPGFIAYLQCMYRTEPGQAATILEAGFPTISEKLRLAILAEQVVTITTPKGDVQVHVSPEYEEWQEADDS
jgi:hypothetical protein